MNVSVERLKIKKVLCQEKYQEVFFRKMRLDASESLRIYDCEADISSLLKKSFWGMSFGYRNSFAEKFSC